MNCELTVDSASSGVCISVKIVSLVTPLAELFSGTPAGGGNKTQHDIINKQRNCHNNNNNYNNGEEEIKF